MNKQRTSKMEYVKVGLMAIPVIVAGLMFFPMHNATSNQVVHGISILSCPTLLKAQNEYAFTYYNAHDEIMKQIKEKKCLEK